MQGDSFGVQILGIVNNSLHLPGFWKNIALHWFFFFGVYLDFHMVRHFTFVFSFSLPSSVNFSANYYNIDKKWQNLKNCVFRTLRVEPIRFLSWLGFQM
jgi:hypothetical protein